MKEIELIICRTNRDKGYRVDFDDIYKQSRLYTNWANPVAERGNKLYFLNQFRCRLSYSISDDLEPVLQRISPLFDHVKDVEIQDLNQKEKIYPVIQEIFSTLKGSAKRFQETATGKFMHMTCPNLFFMVDSVIAGYMQYNGVIKHYFIFSEDYTSLLKYYCEKINELIEDIMQNHGLNRLEAINHIRNLDSYAVGSIPRIIDKHYYSLATHKHT